MSPRFKKSNKNQTPKTLLEISIKMKYFLVNFVSKSYKIHRNVKNVINYFAQNAFKSMVKINVQTA